MIRNRRKASSVIVILALVACCRALAQQAPSSAPSAAPAPPRTDTLGRTTPRGTVLGFLNAGRKGDDPTAAAYLNTRKRGAAAEELAHQLFIVLDRRLPAKLNQLSDKPEGSLSYPNDSDQELVGTVASHGGDVKIVLQRIDRGKSGPVWLFSSSTLSEIPDVYKDIATVSPDAVLPPFLVQKRILHVALFQWFAGIVGLPLLYFAMAPVNRALGALIGKARRRLRRRPDLKNPRLLPGPVRLLILAALIRWAVSQVALSLRARQIWAAIAVLLGIAGLVWLAMHMSSWVEAQIRARLSRRKLTGVVSIVRFARRAGDILTILLGVLLALRYLGVNISTAIAGLGVGGIAVALAAQKTLENVIGGMSLVLDQAVRVGDFMKVGDTTGSVEQVGLRSTRLITNDRTIVSIPNGQIANASLENFSLRDKFWFHHTVGLAYGTTAAQLRDVLAAIAAMLNDDARIERNSARVRLLRFGASSLDVELFAYIITDDYAPFLEIQEELLLRTMELVQGAGAQIALPSQRLYVAGSSRTNEEQALAALRR
ncbi:MAG TPA: mechanosensitive ion channel family protein [Bryobacteraceae bacterium]